MHPPHGGLCLDSHTLYFFLPRTCGGLHAQWHHHWGELLPSPPGRVVGGRDGVALEGWATQDHSNVEMKENWETYPPCTFCCLQGFPDVLEPRLGRLPNSLVSGPPAHH